MTDWRGYLVAFFALVWVANQYMSIYNRLRLDIKHEQVEIKAEEQKVDELKAEEQKLSTSGLSNVDNGVTGGLVHAETGTSFVLSLRRDDQLQRSYRDWHWPIADFRQVRVTRCLIPPIPTPTLSGRS